MITDHKFKNSIGGSGCEVRYLPEGGAASWRCYAFKEEHEGGAEEAAKPAMPSTLFELERLIDERAEARIRELVVFGALQEEE